MDLNRLLPGWRTIKTAVAVMISFAIFLPWWDYSLAQPSGPLQELGPFYACIAAVICMRTSVHASVTQGLSRLLGTLMGGVTGLVAVLINAYFPGPLATTVIFGLFASLTIYLCSLFRQPGACSLAAVICCSVMFSHSASATAAIFYTIARMLETAVGILVAVVVNRVLPTPKQPDQVVAQVQHLEETPEPTQAPPEDAGRPEEPRKSTEN